jgi:hypothetical protein
MLGTDFGDPLLVFRLSTSIIHEICELLSHLWTLDLLSLVKFDRLDNPTEGFFLMGCGVAVARRMFLLGVIRVNDQSQFTLTSMAGEFRLYVNPQYRSVNDVGWWRWVVRWVGASRRDGLV